MPDNSRFTVTVDAPGKIILFGEHAVVYGRPAIAVPVIQVRASATIESRADDAVVIDAPDIARMSTLRDAPADDPLATIIRLTCARLGVPPEKFTVRIRSTIPVASGLGSGAAVSVAVARALGKYIASVTLAPHASVGMPNADISDLAYEVEKLHHGTPSGIDNTVIAFEQPVYFVRGKPIESFRVAKPFTLAIADTGIAAPTKIAVGDVRSQWEADRELFEKLFDNVGTLAHNARVLIEQGAIEGLGGLMTANQILLATMGVSSLEIQRLVDAALGAGALGAKLSGGGRGGNMIALVTEVTQDAIVRALLKAGAKRVIVTMVGGRQ